MFFEAIQNLGWAQVCWLLLALGLALTFEIINGFHDTANAVATVIYTKSLRPTPAVVWSGIWNMLGIFIGGIGVAFSIVHLLPVDMLVQINTNAGLAMVLSLLGAAILWNFGTWYLGLPSSSSHTLIGSILGVGLVNAWIVGKSPVEGLNLGKLGEIGLSLMVSPLVGFAFSALLLLLLKRLAKSPVLNESAKPEERPPWWVRGILIGTSTGVSFAHGSNDGQKGMGLIMLILIGIAPAYFALNLENSNQLKESLEAATHLERILGNVQARNERTTPMYDDEGRVMTVALTVPHAAQRLDETREALIGLIGKLRNKTTYAELPQESRWRLREQFLRLDKDLRWIEKSPTALLLPHESVKVQALHKELNGSIEYVPNWVIIAVALCLGFGTMFGWKRVAVTVGEKIGKSHLTYGQGASAELVAMSTIGIADMAGLPVSTTHVLSSGVAGTMWMNRSGINGRTVKSILLAWVFTLPASMLLSATLFVSAMMLVR